MRIWKRAFCLLLCALCLAGLGGAACAQEDEAGFLDPKELQALTESFLEEKQLKAENFSVGYCYTATGDTWFFNEDKWYYSASTYKVPLMMLLAEEEARGVIDRDTRIRNLPLGEAEELILTYSHNDYAHLMMTYFGTEPECRDLYKQYSDLPDDYYISDFRDYSYFTAHFLTDVMKTLYSESERFPNIIESLLPAQPGHYFKLHISDYDIAQKYGALKEFNHTAGIFYTPNPFILVVMTEHCPIPEAVIGEFGKRMLDYTLELDGKLEAYEKEQAEKQAAEEAARLEAERLAAQQEQERKQAEEAAKQEPAATAQPEVQEPPAKEEDSRGAGLWIALAVLAVLLTALVLVLKSRGKKARRSKYIPKH